MKKPMIMIEGFSGLRESEPFITTAENKKNTQVVIDDWMLGPEKPSNERGANPEYWNALGKAMKVDEAEARRRRCSNSRKLAGPRLAPPRRSCSPERRPQNATAPESGRLCEGWSARRRLDRLRRFGNFGSSHRGCRHHLRTVACRAQRRSA